jgi:hypothetical protein
LPEDFRKALFYGNPDKVIQFAVDRDNGLHMYNKPFEGLIPQLEKRYRNADSPQAREEIQQYMAFHPCPDCHGARLRSESRAVRIHDYAIHQVTALSIAQAAVFFRALTLPGQAPLSPAYQFRVEGLLSAMDELAVTVAGQAMLVTPQSHIHGGLDIGEQVVAEGRIVEGAWILDVLRRHGQPAVSYFAGALEATGELVWQVGGISVLIDDNTNIVEGMEIEDVVMVAFSIQGDGRWLALAIYPVASEPPPNEPTPTPDPGANPELSFEPDELEMAACQLEYILVGTLINEGEEEDDIAQDVLLGYAILRGPQYVSGLELQPSGWEQILPGQAVNFDIHISLTEAWLDAPPGDEFKLRISIASETNNPGGYPTRLTVTLSNTCHGTPTVTPTPGPSLTPSLTPTATITPTPGPTQPGIDCTGASPHPTRMELAERYGVPYETIMYWFCQHYGFGEIDLAYELSAASGVPVADIFGMRASGMGWGAIKRELGGR